MGFILPELIIESIVRDGIKNLKDNPAIIDDIFSELTRAYNDEKYGAAEIVRIKEMILEKNIAVVHSFFEASSKSPCYSIQLGNDQEDQRLGRLDDFEDDLQEQITDPLALADLIKVPNLIPTAYDPLSGQVSVPDTADMSEVNFKYIYQDGSGVEYEIQSGISNTPGDKYFFIEKGLDNVDIANPGFIRTFLDYTQVEIRGVTQAPQLLIGVHTKEALMTKYLYIILKYTLQARKKDMIKRGYFLATLQGSDFTRDLQYEGDMVFTRFLTVSGKCEDTWRSDQVELIDVVDIDAEPVC